MLSPIPGGVAWRGLRQEDADDVTETEVLTAKKISDEDTADDREAESRTQTAASTVGAWLKPFAPDLEAEFAAIESALNGVGLPENETSTCPVPREDARFEALLELINEHMRSSDDWTPGERLVVFTEYKTTLDYLEARLRSAFQDDSAILTLFGGMEDRDREYVKKAFNEPTSPARILLATDAASEGLNLQQTARYLLHWDIPWNPARVEQRNGRLDRHGQARDVQTWHFASEENQDLAFLNLVVEKVHSIREDLGSTGEIFDEYTTRRLIKGEALASIKKEMEGLLENSRKSSSFEADDRVAPDPVAAERSDLAVDLELIAAELDFDPMVMRETLDSAMAITTSRPRIDEFDDEGLCKILAPHPANWTTTIDDSVRLPSPGGGKGPVHRLAFDPMIFIQHINERPIFRNRDDALLLHLGHPMMKKALSELTRRRFDGGLTSTVSRWSVYESHLPAKLGSDAIVQLSIEELAVNDLRETFHHWVKTWRFPVTGGHLGPPHNHEPAIDRRIDYHSFSSETVEKARDLWIEVEAELKDWMKEAAVSLTAEIEEQLSDDLAQALDDANEQYTSRQGEISKLISSNTVKRLEREIEELKKRRQQRELFDDSGLLQRIDTDINSKEDEIQLRKRHHEEVQDQLTKERKRITETLLPRRYTLRGEAQMMPVAVEIILNGKETKA